MAVVARPTNCGIDLTSARFMPAFKAILGEDVEACTPLRIDPADGMLYKADGAALATTEFMGISPRAGVASEPMTVFGVGTVFSYSGTKSAGTLTPGNRYYVSDTAGEIDDAATTGDPNGVFRAINTHELMVIAFS